LYREPEILILDEATSSLDSLAETFVQNTIELLRKSGRTVIVIAHRLSTISLAQRIIVLDKGEIVQDGTFDELAKTDGTFRRMWMHQTIDVSETIKV
jgi:ATP-binding cassette subfamily B protein